MPRKPETIFKDKIRPKLRALPHTWLVKIQQVGIRGTPDFLMCVAGIFVAWELKKDKASKPTRLQLHRLSQIELAGGIARAVYPGNFDECFSELKKIIKERRG